MQIPNYVKSYKAILSALVDAHGRDKAMALIVGGQHEQIGVLETSG